MDCRCVDISTCFGVHTLEAGIDDNGKEPALGPDGVMPACHPCMHCTPSAHAHTPTQGFFLPYHIECTLELMGRGHWVAGALDRGLSKAQLETLSRIRAKSQASTHNIQECSQY
jgi:hypothetical protein